MYSIPLLARSPSCESVVSGVLYCIFIPISTSMSRFQDGSGPIAPLFSRHPVLAGLFSSFPNQMLSGCAGTSIPNVPQQYGLPTAAHLLLHRAVFNTNFNVDRIFCINNHFSCHWNYGRNNGSVAILIYNEQRQLSLTDKGV